LQKCAQDFLSKDIKTVEKLECLKEEDRRKAEEKKQKAAIAANAPSLFENPLCSSFCSGDMPFLSPDFIFNESMFLSSQTNTAFASILAEPSGRSEDA
jgi:hypothetical protein